MSDAPTINIIQKVALSVPARPLNGHITGAHDGLS